MRTKPILGAAVTVALLSIVAAFIGGVVAAGQVSVASGVTVRGVLVVLSICLTAFIWWPRLERRDPPSTLTIGLGLGWVLTLTNWSGNGVVGQLFSSSPVTAAAIDLIIWMAVAVGMTSLLASRTRV